MVSLGASVFYGDVVCIDSVHLDYLDLFSHNFTRATRLALRVSQYLAVVRPGKHILFIEVKKVE